VGVIPSNGNIMRGFVKIYNNLIRVVFWDSYFPFANLSDRIFDKLIPLLNGTIDEN
jgi:hypothetical protein